MDTMKIRYQNKIRTIPYLENQTILAHLLHAGIYTSSFCGGKRTCGKCNVYLGQSFEDLSLVPACSTIPLKNSCIDIPDNFLLEDSIFDEDVLMKNHKTSSASSYGIAVDLGTTTIVVALADLDHHDIIASKKEWNKQIAYGSDVISRINYIMEQENGLDVLCNTVRTQIISMIDHLCAEAGIEKHAIIRMIIAGNTIMEHIFAGRNPSSIATAPFVPETTFRDGKPMRLSPFGDIDIYMVPCIHGYIGGDITAGLSYADIDAHSGTCLLIDIGTNGEIALCKDGIFTFASVACGPAFEGASLACGTVSGTGAIKHISFIEKSCKCQISTVDDASPTGICASGYIDLIAMLKDTGLIQSSGGILTDHEAKRGIDRLTYARLRNTFGYRFLESDSNDNGVFFIRHQPDLYITTSDTRKLLLAKASLRTGIDLLLQEKRVGYDEIDTVFIAGGFGSHIHMDNAVKTGMIPSDFLTKIHELHNSSLGGAVRLLYEPEALLQITTKTGHGNYIELSNHPDFAQIFIENMKY